MKIKELALKIRKAVVRHYVLRELKMDLPMLVTNAAFAALKVARFNSRTRQVIVEVPVLLPWWLGGRGAHARFCIYSQDREIGNGGYLVDSTFSVYEDEQ